MKYRMALLADKCGAFDHHRPHTYSIKNKELKLCPGEHTMLNPNVNLVIHGMGYRVPLIQCPNHQLHVEHLWDLTHNYPEEMREWSWCEGVTADTTLHIGRSWDSHELEDECPCPQEPCGLIDRSKVVGHCNQHPPQAVKTIRQSHVAKDCPGARPDASRD